MRRFVTMVVLLGSFAIVPVAADVGVGVILGSPTGISALFGNRVAVAAAWNVQRDQVHLHGDVWLLHQELVDPVNWFLGAGGKFQLNPQGDSDIRVGIRVPLGVQFFVIPRLELFGEIAPGIRVIPSTSFDLDAGVGIRFHF